MKIIKFPLTRIIFGFILGIIFAYYFKTNLNTILIFIGISFFLLTVIYFAIKKHSTKIISFGILICFLSFFIGNLTLNIHTESYKKSNYTHCKKSFESNQIIRVTIREKLKNNNFNYRYIAVVNQINNRNYNGKIILNIKKDNTKQSLIIGNTLLINGKLIKSKPPKNPFQFNYGKYLENKQIYAQIYLTKGNFIKSKNIKKDIWYYANQIRSRIIRNLNPKEIKSDELNVATALVLGQKQEISDEINKEYQFAGATHLLAVSGLHVGLLMLFISFLLNLLSNSKRNQFIKLFIIITSLFIYAIITGLSPSIIRAVIMFSFIATGNVIQRSNNIIHTLVASALLILLFEPYFLFDVGFQLSYTAVFFIIWLQPILKNIWIPKNKIIKFFWNIFTVSIAAQLGTLPICLYYFHQFPGLFFITNLIVIPLITIIMIIAIITMILAFLNLVPSYLISLLEKSIQLLNFIIKKIASYDQFVITDIPFNLSLLISSFILIIMSITYFQKKSFKSLVITLISLILFQTTLLTTKFNSETQKEYIVFNSTKNSILSERNGNQITIYSSNKNDSDLNKIKPYLIQNSITEITQKNINNTFLFKGKKIMLIDSSNIYLKSSKPDILILIQSPKINLERIIQNLHPKLIIADASNFKNVQDKWEATCLKQKIHFHRTDENGFYKF